MHNSDAATLADLERRTAKIREKFWGGKPLPFPVLLDDDSLTGPEYKTSQFPAFMLVDPQGKVVERGSPERLEEELARMARSDGDGG